MTAAVLENGFFKGDEGKMLRSIYKEHGKVSAILGETLRKKVAKRIDDIVDDTFKKDELKKVNITNLRGFIDDIVKKIRTILEEKDNLGGEENLEATLERIRYFLYLRWISYILDRVKYPHPKKTQDVPDELAAQINYILRDIPLTAFLIFLKSLGVLDVGSEIEIEKELKVLNVNKKDIESNLRALKDPKNSQIGDFKILGVQEVFSGAIADDYYDYPDLRLDRGGKGAKSSFRIRRRKNSKDRQKSYFYTIKRKVDKPGDNASESEDQVDHNLPRDCYEKEFKIEEFGVFRDVLKEFGLRKSRSKRKKRTSYELTYMIGGEKRHIKFDIDKYKNIPRLLEIEGENNEDIQVFRQYLGLQNNVTLNGGSRELYKHYNLYDEYTKFYDVDEEQKTVAWREQKDTFALAKKKKVNI